MGQGMGDRPWLQTCVEHLTLPSLAVGPPGLVPQSPLLSAGRTEHLVPGRPAGGTKCCWLARHERLINSCWSSRSVCGVIVGAVEGI